MCLSRLSHWPKEAHSALSWRSWTTTICRVEGSQTHNKICVVDTANLYRPTFSPHTENPQESVKNLIDEENQ